MNRYEGLREDLEAAIHGPGDGSEAADRLCTACVELLHVDGAAASLMHEGASQGTFGSSGELSRRLDEMQFTLGEGPCMDAFANRVPVLVPDIGHVTGQRWPAFAGAAIEAGVHGVFALPAGIAGSFVGVLDLFRHDPGPLSGDDLDGGMLAAELLAVPLLDLLATDDDQRGEDGVSSLAALERVEVYQATGMIMAQLDVGPTEALVRLRAHAFATNQTASEAAWAVVERRLRLPKDAWREPGAADAGAAP